MKKALNTFFLLCFTSALSFSSNSNSGIFSENCLEKYHGNPEELLSVDLVGNFVDFKGAIAKAEKVSEQIIKDVDFAQVNCKWRIDGQRYIVRLKQISKIELYKSKTPVERFYSKYHTRTEEEMAALQELYDKEVTEKTNMEGSEKVSTAIGMDYEYERIDNIGDAAVWEHKVNDLKVLLGEYQFTLNVDLNEGNEYDLEIARLIANAIIEKACD
jgi:hypothetical protein